MTIGELLADAFSRVREEVDATVAGLTEDQLAWRPDGRGNSIAWLIWHLTRVTDDHVCGATGTEQAWMSGGWADRFGLPFPVHEHGYGHTSDQVAAVRVPADLLIGYHDAVYRATAGYVRGLAEGDLDRIVDKAWDPPVTLGVRLVSVISDDLQHVGQAAYLRGLLPR